ncbi:MAG: alpha/beta fold hydrolase [Myxococcales bacterium]|nr:alpha/beta fold hydrolase [Myxococcales bacterium]MDH3484246.1 alpha/beta fold hydrolase [Myxococcales bacterium]
MWMLLHGFMGSPRSWDRVLSACDSPDEPTVPQLLGHGDDWKRNRVASFEEEVSRLLAIATTMTRPRYLCGYSMGARVALGMLVRGSDLFEGAILVGAHPGLDDAEARTERRAADAKRARELRREGLVGFVDAWEAQPLFASQRRLPSPVLEVQRQIRLSHDAEGLAACLEVLGLAEMPSLGAALSSFEIPITLMAGALDTKFATIAENLSSKVDLLQIVEGVGHNVVLEAPEVVAMALKTREQRAHE